MGITDDVENELELVAVVFAGEEGPVGQEPGEDVPHDPDVGGLREGSGEGRKEGLRGLTLVYILNDSMISGARYHRVATYSDIRPTSLPPGRLVLTLLARPKSHALRSQLALRRLAGFGWRYTMSALWMDLGARRVW